MYNVVNLSNSVNTARNSFHSHLKMGQTGSIFPRNVMTKSLFTTNIQSNNYIRLDSNSTLTYFFAWIITVMKQKKAS